MMKGKLDDDDGIDLTDMEKFLPGLRVSPLEVSSEFNL